MFTETFMEHYLFILDIFCFDYERLAIQTKLQHEKSNTNEDIVKANLQTAPRHKES